MDKRDLKKENKGLFNPKSGVFTIVDVPAIKYLTIEGEGDPNTSQSFGASVETLYAAAYGIKFEMKSLGEDFTVMPLEGLWYCDDMGLFSVDRKNEWKWKLMIMQPENINGEMLKKTLEKAAEKKPELKSMFEKVVLEEYREGKAVQTMYVGPYSDEGPVIAEMHKYIQENGYSLSGHHHEIYLSDPRKCAPEKLKTILRQPIAVK